MIGSVLKRIIHTHVKILVGLRFFGVLTLSFEMRELSLGYFMVMSELSGILVFR